MDQTSLIAAQMLLGDSLPTEPVVLDRLARCLRSNRVPIAALSDKVLDWLRHAGEPASTFAAQALARHNASRGAYREVADAWLDHGLEPVLIKSSGLFPSTSSNVDVLVAARARNKARQILEQLGYL